MKEIYDVVVIGRALAGAINAAGRRLVDRFVSWKGASAGERKTSLAPPARWRAHSGITKTLGCSITGRSNTSM